MSAGTNALLTASAIAKRFKRSIRPPLARRQVSTIASR